MFKKSESKEIISKAKELFLLIQNRKIIEKHEKDLKEFFKENFPQGVIAGDILVTTKECVRSGLNKDQLTIDFGAEVIEKYLTETAYVQIDVKEVG